MRLKLEGNECYAATGGRLHEEGRPWVVFVHGAGFSHLTWIQQTRALAYDGYNVLAPDLPGHNLSGGKAIDDIAGMAEWLLALMSAAGCMSAVLAGHSMGGLIALEAARQSPKRVEGVVFIATAASIPVSKNLLTMARNDEAQAIASMVSWAYGPQAHLHENDWPGASHVFTAVDIMKLNPSGTLGRDLEACNTYGDGEANAAALDCTSLCIFGLKDRMTPIRGGRKLAGMLRNNRRTIELDCGHTIPTEKPRQVLDGMREFLRMPVPG